MPIYDYRCDHCGHVFSQVQSFHDSALETCPNCGKRPRRLLTVPAIVFKGSGWYKTDSRAPAASEKAEKAAAKGEKAEKAEAASDAKSEKSGAAPAAAGEKGDAKSTKTSSDAKPAAKDRKSEAAS